MVYYILLVAILLFPFLYIAAVSKRSKRKNKWLKKSDIETLSQYILSLCMSITLGIRTSVLPFLITTFFVLSALLIYSCMKADESGSCSKGKVNNVLHKLTFWLYHFMFLVMSLLIYLKNNNDD